MCYNKEEEARKKFTLPDDANMTYRKNWPTLFISLAFLAGFFFYLYMPFDWII